MKSIIFMISLFVISCQSKENLDKYFGECFDELGFAKGGGNQELKEDDPKVKCFTACLFKKFGMMNDGKIDYDATFKLIEMDEGESANEYAKTLETCIEKAHKEANECDTAFVMKECLRPLGME